MPHSNKLTAVIITGTAEEISSFVNSSFNNIVNAKLTFEDKQLQYKYKYLRPPNNFTQANLTNSQIKTIDNYLSSNDSFKFKDLISHINSSKRTTTPSNAAISKYLTNKNYNRYQFVLNDSTTYYGWELS